MRRRVRELGSRPPQITNTGAAHKNDEERERANAAWFALERTQ